MKRSDKKVDKEALRNEKWPWLPRLGLGAAVLWLLVGLIPPRGSSSFDLNGFARLPVLQGGRIKPLDTVARTSLLLLSGKQTVRMDDRTSSAMEWLTDVLFRPEEASHQAVFEIDNPDVLGSLGMQQGKRRRFAFAELEPHLKDIEKDARDIDAVKPSARTQYQTALMDLQNRLNLYQKLQNTVQVAGTKNMVQALRDFEDKLIPMLANTLKQRHQSDTLFGPMVRALEPYRFLEHVAEFLPIPPLLRWQADAWVSYGTAVMSRLERDSFPPGVLAYAALSDAWRKDDASAFNQALHEYQDWLKRVVPKRMTRVNAEYLFNYFEPFYRSLSIYLLAFLFVCASWMVGRRVFSQTALSLLGVALVVHTAGLLARMVIQGRPPVTNLYSSAVFVGWVAVVLGAVLERIYRNGIGTLVASAIGFTTLIIAHHLAASGDTLEMMRAVLDSNFWLATHVVCITIGYGSTFLAGVLAILYIFRSRLDRNLTAAEASSLERMVYGVVCFSTFFSFLGTILGGIWADQSWGRFWGWDPKENGALMIVLWNTFILHARVGKFVGREGTMKMAIFGNVVTAFSWFGVNMLGIGLHSYGFMDKAFVWLVVFSLSQVALIAWAAWRPRI